MNYAHANNLNGNNCFHCGNQIASHDLGIICSDDETTELARSLQRKLDEVYVKAVDKGYELPQGLIMTGAIVATVGSTVLKAAALSGGNAGKIFSVMQGNLGRDVTLVADNVPAATLKSILGLRLQALAATVESSRTTSETPQAILQNGQAGSIPAPNYPVGSCAAQKLLNFVIQYALESKQKIQKMAMSEIFWKTNGVKSQWSTGDVVPSCNTCLYVLPMMLCNYDDSLDKVKYLG